MKSLSHSFLVLVVILSAIGTVLAQDPQPSPASPPQQSDVSTQNSYSITNKDVVDMVKAGLSAEIVIAKIKASANSFDTSAAGLQELKAASVPDVVILAMLQPKTPTSTTGAGSSESKTKRLKDELTTAFQRLQSSVVTVWSETSTGTGFIIDKDGLVLTNQHVVGPSRYLAVQFDEKRKIPATLLASNPEKDVAVLWINLYALPDATVAPIAQTDGAEPPIVEGERVLTIGSPLNQRKIMTSGIARKVEKRAIISDININHGNSGGPLFNSLGEVVGVTTFGDPDRQGGPGISGIVRIEETETTIREARSKMSELTKPEAKLLPVDPIDLFPLEAIKETVAAEKFELDRYSFGLGEFEILLMTPALKYRMTTEAERKAAKTREKRNKKEGAVQGTSPPVGDFKNWQEYVGDYKPILFIQAMPKIGESFWGAVGRGVAANYGIHKKANFRFKTDFYRMTLLCGDKEVQPIHPGKIFYLTNENNYFVKSNDATYAGIYSYPADAISPACGQVRLEVFSEKNPTKADTKNLDAKSILRISQDFEPYLKAKSPQ